MTRGIGIIAAALLSMTAVAEAQTSKVHRAALLVPFSTEEGLPYRTAFLEAMRALGYVEGRDVVFDVRTSDRDTTGVERLVDELIALKPDVLVGAGRVGVEALRMRNLRIPIVLTSSIESALGCWADTDTTGAGLACKIIEDGARQAARRVGAVFVSYPVASRDDIVRAFAQMKSQRPDVLLPCPVPLLFNNRDGALRERRTASHPFTSFVIASLPPGVLFSYGPSF